MRSTRRAWGVRQPSCRKAVWTKLRETGFRPPAVLWLTSRCGLAVVGQRVHRTSSHARIGPPTWPPGWPSTRVGRVPACCRSFSKPASAGPWPVPGPVPGRGSGPSSGKVAPRGAARCAGYNPGPLTRGGPSDGRGRRQGRRGRPHNPELARRAALPARPSADLPGLRLPDQPARDLGRRRVQDVRGGRDRGPGPRVRPNPHRGRGRLFADRALAEAGPEFFTAQLTRLAGAIGRRDGAAVLAVLDYLAAEGDRQVADALFDHMTTAGLFAVTKPKAN